MANISLRFESLKNNDDLQLQAGLIEERLKELDSVEDVEAEVEETKRHGGAEVVAAIAAGITIISKTEDFVSALRRLIPEIKKLARDLGLTKVTVNVSGKPIPIGDFDDMSDEQVGHPDC